MSGSEKRPRRHRGASRRWPSRPLSGHGSVGADGRTALYEMQWMGVAIRQATSLDGDVVSVDQRGLGFVESQRLARTTAPAK